MRGLVARSSQSTTHYSYFGGPSSGTANPRQSCGRRRVTRSWWNCLCDRQFAAILRSTARCLQLGSFRDSTLSQRSLCKWTRSPFIVSSRVALPTGYHPWSRQGCIEEWRNCGKFLQKAGKNVISGGRFWLEFWFHFWVPAILASIRGPRNGGPKTGPSKFGFIRRQARKIWYEKVDFSD